MTTPLRIVFSNRRRLLFSDSVAGSAAACFTGCSFCSILYEGETVSEATNEQQNKKLKSA
jgi:hypothetical protein